MRRYSHSAPRKLQRQALDEDAMLSVRVATQTKLGYLITRTIEMAFQRKIMRISGTRLFFKPTRACRKPTPDNVNQQPARIVAAPGRSGPRADWSSRARFGKPAGGGPGGRRGCAKCSLSRRAPARAPSALCTLLR
jgi:hypothetical protein